MGDINQINDVASANISQVNDVAKANIHEVNDQGVAASGATLWTIVCADTNVATASNSDTTSWTAYDNISGSAPSASVDHIAVAVGQDGSSNTRYVCSFEADNAELAYTDDPSNGNAWTVVQNLSNGNTIPCRAFDLAWGNGVWLTIGKMSSSNNNVLRSTDGASWTAVDVSGVTGIANTGCYGIVYSGLNSENGGIFYFSQQNRIYKSTDGGASWSLQHTLLNASNADPGDIRGLFVTNSSLVAWVDANPAFIYSCSLSDDTDWNTGTQVSTASSVNTNTRMNAANGRFIVTYGLRYWAADINGKTITLEHDNAFITDGNATFGSANCVAGDGTGTWIIGCLTGDVIKSTDDGDSWSVQATNIAPPEQDNENMEHITSDLYKPI